MSIAYLHPIKIRDSALSTLVGSLLYVILSNWKSAHGIHTIMPPLGRFAGINVASAACVGVDRSMDGYACLIRG